LKKSQSFVGRALIGQLLARIAEQMKILWAAGNVFFVAIQVLGGVGRVAQCQQILGNAR
jgi:hypothetical protein